MGGLIPNMTEGIEVPKTEFPLGGFKSGVKLEAPRIPLTFEKSGDGFSTQGGHDFPIMTISPGLSTNVGVKYMTLGGRGSERASPDPTEMQSTTMIDPRLGIGADLFTLGGPKPTLVGTIEGLTYEWEAIFEKGGKILSSGTRYFLSGDFLSVKPPVGEKEFKIYQAWLKAQKVDPIEPPLAQADLEALTSFLRERGVSLTFEVRTGPQSVSLLAGQDRDFFFYIVSPLLSTLNGLLRLLSPNVFSGDSIRELRLNSPHTDKFVGSSSLDQKVLTLFPEALRGSRRNLAAQILFQIGRAGVLRLESPDVMMAMYLILSQGEAFFALDWGEGFTSRLQAQRESFQNFMGDLVVAYVAAGPTLRQFIEDLGDSQQGQAWQVLYERVRRDLFDGKEYDYWEELKKSPDEGADRYLSFMVSDEEGKGPSDFFNPFFVKSESALVKALETKRILKGLEDKRTHLFLELRALGDLQGSARSYPPDVLVKDVEKVLDRAYPLMTISEGSGEKDNARLLVDEYMTAYVHWSKELYPDDWKKTQGRNLFDGEFFFRSDDKGLPLPVEGAEYRFARMLQNAKEGRPLVGELGKEEQEQVVNFVARALKVNVSSYPDAQAALRDQMIRMTPKAKKALKAANLSLRTTLLDSFLGSSLEKELLDLPQAFRLAKFLGELGFTREISLSIDLSTNPPKPILSLGDLNRTINLPNRFGILHTHSLVFTNRRKRAMGWQDTLAPEFGKELRATGLVIFSDKDIGVMAHEAQVLARKKVAVPFLYDPKTRIYQNWVQHPYGMSSVKIEIGQDGNPEKISVEYALYEKEGLDKTHLTESQKLKNWMKANFPNGEVSLEKVGIEKLEREVEGM